VGGRFVGNTELSTRLPETSALPVIQQSGQGGLVLAAVIAERAIFSNVLFLSHFIATE
jgi:hypothetical protein